MKVRKRVYAAGVVNAPGVAASREKEASEMTLLLLRSGEMMSLAELTSSLDCDARGHMMLGR